MREGKSGQYRAPHPDNFGTPRKEFRGRDSATENNYCGPQTPEGGFKGGGKGENVR